MQSWIMQASYFGFVDDNHKPCGPPGLWYPVLKVFGVLQNINNVI